MLEWGSAGASMKQVEAEAEALVRRAGDAVGCVVPGRWRRLTVRNAIAEAFGTAVRSWDDLATIPGPFGPGGGKHDDAAHLSWLVDEAAGRFDPEQPTWLVGWPARMTTSAGLDPTDPTLTQRSELYWRGMELSDGFPFSNDAAWQRARSEEENESRAAAGLPRVALDERFLAAVPSLPEGAGMALGVDRLCLALLGGQRLRDVMTFSWTDR